MNEWSMTGGWQPGVSVGMVGTFPPTECGLATFAAALGDSLRAVLKLGGQVDLVTPGTLANDGKVIDDVRIYT